MNERKYDRDYLLSSEKRNQVMQLWEIQKFGSDSFGDPEHVRVYGMRFVMAGLVPAIHVFNLTHAEDVDARDKRGHDEHL